MKKTIGILGGMGALATVDLFQKIVTLTEAHSDNDHIRVYIDSNSWIPDRTTAILYGGESPVPQMLDALKHLEACGADCIAMPCNSGHYFLPELEKATDIPFISILEVTAQACKAKFPGGTAGILGSTGTLKTDLYSGILARYGMGSLMPTDEEQKVMMEQIAAVKSNRPLTDPAPVQKVLDAMKARGATFFIWGCTELPIMAQQLKLRENYVDPTTELAKAAILFCGYKLREDGAL